MVRQIAAWVVIITVMALCPVAGAVDVATFRAGQAVARYPVVKAYVEVLDQAGSPVDTIEKEQVNAMLGEIRSEVNEVKRFAEAGEGVAYVFLVDISRSLSAGQFGQMKAALSTWIKKMRESDRAAVITFGEKVTLVQDYTADKNALNNSVKTLEINDNKTQLHRGITKAIELSHRVEDSLPSRRVIVMLSDGEDDFPGGMTRDEVLTGMKEDRIPIYAIGFSQKGQKGASSLKKLGEFARVSGGEFFDGNGADLAKLYETVQQKILRSFLVKIDISKATADGKLYRLQLTLNNEGKTMTDGLDLRLFAPIPVAVTQKPWYKKIPVWGYGAAGGVLILIVIFIVMARKKKTARLAAEEAERKRRRAEDEALKKKAAEEAAKVSAEKKLQEEQLTIKKAEAPGLKMKLSVIGSSGSQKDYRISLSTQAYIGRSLECDLAITDDEEISKKHCELVMEKGYVLINDLNSTNGTYVNGVPVKTGHRLKSGDLVMLGRTEMRLIF